MLWTLRRRAHGDHCLSVVAVRGSMVMPSSILCSDWGHAGNILELDKANKTVINSSFTFAYDVYWCVNIIVLVKQITRDITLGDWFDLMKKARTEYQQRVNVQSPVPSWNSARLGEQSFLPAPRVVYYWILSLWDTWTKDTWKKKNYEHCNGLQTFQNHTMTNYGGQVSKKACMELKSMSTQQLDSRDYI